MSDDDGPAKDGVVGGPVGIHAANIIIGVAYYWVMKFILMKEGDPPPDKGLANKRDPTYVTPLQFNFVKEYIRLSVMPSIFYSSFHIFFALVGAEKSFSTAFAQESDAWTQFAFTLLIMIHCGTRQLSFYLKRNEHRTKVVEAMGLRGNETILDVKCNKGYWTMGIAEKLKAGGRILAMDMWDSEDTPFDGQWALENSRHEEVSGRVEVMNYGDPHYLVYKDDIFTCTVCTYLETEDEINFYNLISEMVRVTQPGGKLMFIMPYHPPNLLKENLQDLGLKDIHSKLITTAYLMNVYTECYKPAEMDTAPPRIDRSENAVTDESPGFVGEGGGMLYCLGAIGFYFVAMYTVIVMYSWDSWMVPNGLEGGDTMAWGFMAENTVWFCWAVVDIHWLLVARPVYIVKRIGAVNLWAAYVLQFFLMVLIFNLSTWLPLMILSAATGVESVAIRAVFRVLARPAIGSTLDGFFTRNRQRLFLKTWKPDWGDRRNRYRKPRKNKRRKRDTDALLDDLEGPEPEDAFAPGL